MKKKYRSRDDHDFRQTFRSLPTFGKKMEYLWDYYHLVIIGVIAAIVIGVSIGFTVYNNSAPIYLNGAFVNVFSFSDAPGYQEGYLESAFLQDCLGLDENDRTKITYISDIPLKTGSTTGEEQISNINSTNMLDVRMAAHEIDYFLSTRELVNILGSRFSSTFDLRKMLTEEELERYQDRLVFVGNSVPVGIDITGSGLIEKLGLEAKGPICLSWVAYSERMDHFRPFFDFIMSACP